MWNKVSADIKKEFDSKHVSNKICLKTKIKSYGNEAKYFHDNETTKAYSDSTYLAVTSLDSALKKDENYYPQVF